MKKYFKIENNCDSIFCKLYCNDVSAISRAVIFGHGFTGFKDNSSAEKAAFVINERYNDTTVVTFDLPCHGDDKRELRLEACDRYLGAVIDYARNCLGAAELYSYAHSFGGYLSLKYIHDHGNPFVKSAYRSPAVNMYHVLTRNIMSEELLEKAYGSSTVQFGFERKTYVTASFLDDLKCSDVEKYDFRQYSGRIMIMHGTKDEIVPFDAAETFSDRNRIRFVPFSGADHRFTNNADMDRAISYVLDFFGM